MALAAKLRTFAKGYGETYIATFTADFPLHGESMQYNRSLGQEAYVTFPRSSLAEWQLPLAAYI